MIKNKLLLKDDCKNPLGFPVFSYRIRDFFLFMSLSLFLIAGLILCIEKQWFSLSFAVYSTILSLIAMEFSIRGQRRVYLEIFFYIIFLISLTIIFYITQIFVRDSLEIKDLCSHYFYEFKNLFLCERLFIWGYVFIVACLQYIFFFRYRLVISLFVGFFLAIIGSIFFTLLYIYQIYDLSSVREYGIYVIILWISLILFLGISFELQDSKRYFSYRELSILCHALMLPVCVLISLYVIYPSGIEGEEISYNMYFQFFLLGIIPLVSIVSGIVFNRVSTIIASFITLLSILYFILQTYFQSSLDCMIFSFFICGILSLLLILFWYEIRNFVLFILSYTLKRLHAK
ncbi:hypothetical protein CKC_03975 [Candidatus Liberibacter solanacearum CLso-ZC1]|uniref:DUF4401 domain-containing protein n=1 Tax=Liberibacter solanacearum (strain CLso-ZC1) TaxID=658172 RepID=E4UB65_LIBSC|nr:hypothetical protein CKC_03975 [Candidatus Liberibacter solanacearum CLso-ZC1]